MFAHLQSEFRLNNFGYSTKRQFKNPGQAYTFQNNQVSPSEIYPVIWFS